MPVGPAAESFEELRSSLARKFPPVGSGHGPAGCVDDRIDELVRSEGLADVDVGARQADLRSGGVGPVQDDDPDVGGDGAETLEKGAIGTDLLQAGINDGDIRND